MCHGLVTQVFSIWQELYPKWNLSFFWQNVNQPSRRGVISYVRYIQRPPHKRWGPGPHTHGPHLLWGGAVYIGHRWYFFLLDKHCCSLGSWSFSIPIKPWGTWLGLWQKTMILPSKSLELMLKWQHLIMAWELRLEGVYMQNGWESISEPTIQFYGLLLESFTRTHWWCRPPLDFRNIILFPLK